MSIPSAENFFEYIAVFLFFIVPQLVTISANRRTSSNSKSPRTFLKQYLHARLQSGLICTHIVTLRTYLGENGAA